MSNYREEMTAGINSIFQNDLDYTLTRDEQRAALLELFGETIDNRNAVGNRILRRMGVNLGIDGDSPRYNIYERAKNAVVDTVLKFRVDSRGQNLDFLASETSRHGNTLLEPGDSPEARQRNEQLDATLKGMTPAQRGQFVFDRMTGLEFGKITIEKALSMSDSQLVAAFPDLYHAQKQIAEIDNFLKDTENYQFTESQKERLRKVADIQPILFVLKSRMDYIANPYYQDLSLENFNGFHNDDLMELQNDLDNVPDKFGMGENPAQRLITTVIELRSNLWLSQQKALEQSLNRMKLSYDSMEFISMNKGQVVTGHLDDPDFQLQVGMSAPIMLVAPDGRRWVMDVNNNLPTIAEPAEWIMDKMHLFKTNAVIMDASRTEKTNANEIDWSRNVMIFDKKGAISVVRAGVTVESFSSAEYMNKVMDRAEKANEGFFIGSSAYRNMLKACKDLHSNFVPLGVETDIVDRAEMQNRLAAARDAAAAYLRDKGIDPANIPENYGKNERERARIAAALELHDFTDGQLAMLPVVTNVIEERARLSAAEQQEREQLIAQACQFHAHLQELLPKAKGKTFTEEVEALGAKATMPIIRKKMLERALESAVNCLLDNFDEHYPNGVTPDNLRAGFGNIYQVLGDQESFRKLENNMKAFLLELVPDSDMQRIVHAVNAGGMDAVASLMKDVEKRLQDAPVSLMNKLEKQAEPTGITNDVIRMMISENHNRNMAPQNPQV